MSTSLTPDRAALYRKAVRHLSRKCPVMKAAIAQVGPCTWAPVSDDPFTILVRCVVYQQISTKAAKSIFDRLTAVVGGLPLTRARLAALTEAHFKQCGVSGPKQRTLQAVAAHLDANPDLLPGIETRDDALVRAQLTAIKGIGPWSADMFLMFAIARTDVLPVSDLGVRVAVRKLFALEELPGVKDVERLAEPWRPYRSVATWYLWRSLDPTSPGTI